MIDDPIYNSVKIEKNKKYFLYIGEIKTLCINEFLREPISKVYGCEVDFIAIVPDVMKRYPEANLMVINPDAKEASERLNQNVSCRLPGRRFAAVVSANRHVVKLVEELCRRQGELLISMYQSLPEMTLDQLEGVRVIGPASSIAHKWNSKFHMYQELEGIVPLPDHHICQNRNELLQFSEKLFREWPEGVFLSLEYSAAGAFSFLAESREELLNKAEKWPPPYLLSRYIPHDHDPTVLGVVANESDVYIGGIADQQMVEINKFRGSIYPSVLGGDWQEELKEMTRKVGRKLGRSGYRGIFGCDYIVGKDGRLFFVEVNARKQGTTMEMCCNLENSLPQDAPNLLELEYYAVTENRFPSNLVELKGNPRRIHWGTYNLKVDEDVYTTRGLPMPEPERNLFQRIAHGADFDSGFIVVEHIGENFLVKEGAFLGRVIAVAKNFRGVREGLEEGKKILQRSFERIRK